MDTQTRPHPTASCRTLIASVFDAADELRQRGTDAGIVRGLLLMPTALLRPAELIAPDITLRAGRLRVPARAIGQQVLPDRDVPLGHAALEVIGGTGLLYERLGVGEHGPGGYLRMLSAAYAEVAAEGLDTVEQLWAHLLASAAAEQTPGPARRAVTHYAGLYANGGDSAESQSLTDLATFLDDQVRACGYHVGEPGLDAAAA